MQPKAFPFKAWVGTQFTLLARVYDETRSLITIGTVSSITWKVFNEIGTNVSSGTMVVADSVHNTLQKDGKWTADSTGYNFAGTIPDTAITATGYCRVEINFTTTSGVEFPIVFRGVGISLESG